MSSSNNNPYSEFGDHEWPTTLYDELHDQGVLAQMCYVMGFILDAAREAKEKKLEFQGLVLDETQGNPKNQFRRSNVNDAELVRSFTPKELKDCIQVNESIFKSLETGNFTDKKLQGYYSFLDKLEERAQHSSLERPLVLEEFDDVFQTKELVYGVTRDSINKRITVVFRGTLSGYSEYTNEVSRSNWFANVNIRRKTGKMPKVLEEDMKGMDLKFHNGFYGTYRMNPSGWII